jgi:taurine dioxygenase
VQDGHVLGETLLASAVHAYDTLPDRLKAPLGEARAVHRYADRYRKRQDANARELLTAEQLEKVPDVSHPAFLAHPVTGGKVLFVNEGFTVYIEGLPKTESDSLLRELFAYTVRPEVLYVHQWRQGDLLMWDNCLVQHRAIRDYAPPLRRLMHRTTVAGPPGTP